MSVESLRTLVDSVFDVYEVRNEGDKIKFYGVPLVDSQTIYRELLPKFQKSGYKLELKTEYGEHVIVAKEEGEDEFPWTNVALALTTLLTTLFAGSFWYGANPISDPVSVIEGWPFALSVMFVLGSHEFGHYVMSKYHGVDATLPYFIPFPSFIGTMGAVIRVKGIIPDKKALFDIGIAGPILGLVATVIVTIVGLHLPPVEITAPATGQTQTYIQLHFPPLFEIIASVVGMPKGVADNPNLNLNPVVIGGWVGMFVTFLNLIPAGQLDGGHILKSIIGDYAKKISYAVPIALFGLGAYIEFVQNSTGTIWFIWGFMTLLVNFMGSAQPLENTDKLGRKRIALALIVFVLGILSFTPIPISISGA